ncbi:nucleotidyltransferase [Aeromicrobium fastidiosum]|jgi:hypothetical protein|uniref:nucleotidyltransferase domain-containing protein n=1 Tax=Aeromicrobium fastidiosum TaxID=52699 RepID=UPI00202358F7|nr:nucleotidyltransferase [Aeromicrobium fastidiosum]MCL8250366.1 nucleotidyltransferase [Aeromicrobium fastidiosum]
MAQLATSFNTAQKNVEPSDEDRDNAPEAHQAVADVLKDDAQLKEWGIDPFLIGSYGRRVSIRRVLDVDMFCRLAELPDEVSAETVIAAVERVLGAAYDSVKAEGGSITVLIPDTDGLYADIVPARKAGAVWEIAVSDEGWVQTNPIQLADLKETKNEETDELYVPCVKLLRQVRRTLCGRAKPGGFAVEMALFTAHEEGLVDGSSMSEFFTSAIEGVADVLARVANDGFEMPDPTIPGAALTFGDDADWDMVAGAFTSAAATAREALEMDDEQSGKAALLLQSIFGSNEDYDQVFPMPNGYNDDGSPKASVRESRPGSREVTPGEHRFG